MKATDLINYRAISQVLSGNSDSIRSGRIPTKYQDDINELMRYVQCWLDHKKGKY